MLFGEYRRLFLVHMANSSENQLKTQQTKPNDDYEKEKKPIQSGILHQIKISDECNFLPLWKVAE